MLNFYHFCLPLKVSTNVKVGLWIASWSCWVVERLFPKNPKFLEIGNQVYISHLQQTGKYQTGPDCQTFYQSPNIHSIHSIPNIHRQLTKCQHTFRYSQSCIKIRDIFSTIFFLIKSLITAINIFTDVHNKKISDHIFRIQNPVHKSCWRSAPAWHEKEIALLCSIWIFPSRRQSLT